MRRSTIISGGALALVAIAITMLALTAESSRVAAQGTVYTVTIENLTRGQPFTPPLLVAHAAGADMFTVGQKASAELQQIAENGNLDQMVARLKASPAVSSVVVGSSPVMAGQSARLTIDVTAGSTLSWVSMLICTNDGFTGINSLAVTGATTLTTNAYDAGTERNTEDFADIVPPCQALVPVSSSDAGTGMSNPALAEGGTIVMHSGVKGGNDLTASHMWTNPVARVTISAGGTVSPPSTGSGGLFEHTTGTEDLLLAGSVAVALLVIALGVTFAAWRRT